jgi:uncharacterized membrane protein
MDVVEWLAIVRYLHVLSGIIWIGLLYYFNLVQVPSFAQMEAPARSNAIQNLVPRALLWFRYGALATVTFGILYIAITGIDSDGDYFDTNAFKSILVGGTLGIIMFLNVWGIIWPNQKKIIAAVTATARDGTPAPADQPKWARQAFLASRTNVALSIPMLFFMIASGHLSSIWN